MISFDKQHEITSIEQRERKKWERNKEENEKELQTNDKVRRNMYTGAIALTMTQFPFLCHENNRFKLIFTVDYRVIDAICIQIDSHNFSDRDGNECDEFNETGRPAMVLFGQMCPVIITEWWFLDLFFPHIF